MPELNGVPVDQSDLKSLALTNYGHYTSMRVDDHYIRGLSHHLDRLVRDCQIIFNADLDREKVREFIRHATENKPGSFVIRVTVFDPTLEIGKLSASVHPHVLVTTRPATALPAPPLRVQTVIYKRDLPAVKHVGLFGPLWHRRAAQLNDFDDSLFIDENSFISEGPTWNIGFFDGDRVVWPEADILPGITMRLLQAVHEKSVTLPINITETVGMEAAFATNTTVGVRPISKIDDLTLSESHQVFDDLYKEYMAIPAERIY